MLIETEECFESLCANLKPEDWYAIPILEEQEGKYYQWHFAPKEWWDKYGHMPDVCIEPDIPQFDSVMEWTWETDLSYEEAIEYLKSLGFTVLLDAVWWWDR